MRTDNIIFLIVMGCITIFLIWKAVQNKRKYGTIIHPFRHTEYYDPTRDPTKTDYYERVEETVRQREWARQQKKAEKARSKGRK